jgi:nitrite reductase/ring-hydroxylating ferredoxin subunit
MASEQIGGSSEYPEGQLKSVSTGGRTLLVSRVEGKLFAMDGRCSHMGFDLSRGRMDEYLVTCKLHGAQFDIRTGERLRNMSAHDLTVYPVMEENGKVFVELP